MAQNEKSPAQKIQDELLSLRQEVEKYKKIFFDNDGKIDSEEQKKLDTISAAIDKTEVRLSKALKKKQATSAKPKAPSGTSPSELKLPAFLPNVSVTNGSIKYEHSFDADIHKKISQQKTFPVCPGLKLGGEISVESKASLKLSIEGAYKSASPKLPTNEWSSYELKTAIGANITSTGNFSLVLTDTLSLLAAKFGVEVQCTFNNKQIEVTNFFSGGQMTVDAFALSCGLKGSLGAGETLDEIHQLVRNKPCPNFVEWSGTKYTLLRVGVTITATDQGIIPSVPTVGLHQPGIDALGADLTAVYNKAKAKLIELQDLLVDVAVITFPMARVALLAYELLGNLYDYITTDENSFENNKDIYTKACNEIVSDMMKVEHQDPKKLKEFALIVRDKKKLEAYYKELMEKAQNIQLIKDIYDNLNKETKEGVDDAKENLNQIITDVDLTFKEIYDVKEKDDKYLVYFKVLVDTSGPVVIPSVKSTVTCNGTVLCASTQDTNDTYDGVTSKVYDGYWVELSKSELQKALGGKSLTQSTWNLTLHADYPGHFKDVNRDFDISNEIKKNLK